jgi:thioredoxin-related protein
MNKLSLAVIAICLMLLFAATASADNDAKPAEKAKIEWLAFDTALALFKADTSGDKHMFVDFTASWCGWCKRMEREAFADPEVIAFVNENFIPVKVWGDSQNMLDIDGYKISEMNLARSEFRVQAYPTFWFLTPEQAKVGPVRGYKTTDVLMEILTYVDDVKYDTTQNNQQAPEKEGN